MAAFGVVGGYLALQLLSYGSQKEDALALGGGFLLFAQLGGSAVLVYGLFKGSTGPPVPPGEELPSFFWMMTSLFCMGACVRASLQCYGLLYDLVAPRVGNPPAPPDFSPPMWPPPPSSDEELVGANLAETIALNMGFCVWSMVQLGALSAIERGCVWRPLISKGLLWLMVSVNVAVWIDAVLHESDLAGKDDWGALAGTEHQLNPLLFPCVVEYSVLAMTIWWKMWEGETARQQERALEVLGAPARETVAAPAAFLERRLSRASSRTSVRAASMAAEATAACAAEEGLTVQAEALLAAAARPQVPWAEIMLKGAALVVSVLAITSLVGVVKIPSTQYESDFEDAVYTGLRLIVYSVLAIITWWLLVEVKRRARLLDPEGLLRMSMEADDIVLLLSFCFCVCISCLEFIGEWDAKRGAGDPGERICLRDRLLAWAVILVQLASLCFQVLFIRVTVRGRPGGTALRGWPAGKAAVLLLIIVNATLWLLNLLSSSTHVEQEQVVFSPRSWLLIEAVFFPFVVLFRFHSVTCLCEVLAHIDAAH